MRRDCELLLVEDDPNDVFVALRALRRAGIDAVRVARDGLEALEMLGLEGSANGGSLQPRVILLDLQMPRMNGFELLRQLRQDEATRDIPVVVISSTQRESDVRACYRLGANSFLVKLPDESSPGSYFADAARYWLGLNRVPDGGQA